MLRCLWAACLTLTYCEDRHATASEKIALLVAELGLTQDAFATRAGLNRNTARRVLLHPEKPLRTATLQQCASTLGFTVHELRELPVEHLILRLRQGTADAPQDLERLAMAQQPELLLWMEQNPERAKLLTASEREELLSLQGTGGSLTSQGVEHFVAIMERRRELHRRLDVIAGTEYLDLLERLMDLIYSKTQP